MGIHDRDYYQDEPQGLGHSFKRQSMVTKLVIANAAVFIANFLLSSVDGSWLMEAMANYPGDLRNPLRWWTLISAGFAHDPNDYRHILFNMVALYFLGPDVEDRLGRKEFLAFYLTTMVLASLASDLRYLIFIPEAAWPTMLGASGAVVGVTILYALFFPKRKLLLMLVIPVPAWGVAILIVAMSILGTGERVAHDVHLAGAVLAAVYFYSGVRLTSLGSWLPQRSSKPKLRVVSQDAEEELVREGDRILDKVHREGEQSLTRKERKILEKYSRHMRERREG